MQHRMKTHPLTQEGITALLDSEPVAVLATVNGDGSPYAAPIHPVYDNGILYFHGLPKGQKVDNIRRDGRVSLTVYHMGELLLPDEPKPCNVNTAYQSVIVAGRASMVEDLAEKERALRAIIQKYTPGFSDAPMPDAMVKGTAVIRIDPIEITGKYYE